ncbi:MAG: tRNA (adenosine(37)-N6)-threonylcarbamoyltransferase complex ATPase subunit type 1 TsaE [Rhodospirillaceae bacterium]|nr:MAG: tRNA (adenosine(37)-N6)-threonylcarbamoyltransferase complex ATPase subunit type 1 TsaE [Rhodospirillaceae bacterium]
MRRFRLETAEQTEALGAALATLARAGMVFTLAGPLGAGKTCLARGLITALKPAMAEEIVSPTFTLVQTYDTAAGPVWHFDLYRVKHAEDVIELGLEDALGDVAVIEWPDRLGRFLPADRIDVTLTQAGDGREAEISGQGKYAEAVEAWKTKLRETK